MIKNLSARSTLLMLACLLGQSGHAGVLSSPDIIRVGDANYPAVETRRFQGISSLALSPNGRVWATWYAGPTAAEDENNYVVLASSGDEGRPWSEVLVVDPDGPGPVRAFDSQLWTDPDGRLWLLWAQAINYGIRAQTWAMIADDPEDPNTGWGDPFHVAPGVMMNKPTVLTNGDWLFPISCWEARVSDSPNAASANVYLSKGEWAGCCFRLHGTALVPLGQRSFDEHMIVERAGGRLWMLVRIPSGIGESVSTDGGRSWSDVTPAPIAHPSARFFIRRLNSGNLLLVKHGPIDQRTGRTDLTAFVSKDDGESWQGGFLLDDRNGISYPDGQQAADGTIFITYDYSRRIAHSIYMATFTEADVLAGRPVSDQVHLRMPISQPGVRLADPVAPYDPDEFELNDNADGVPFVDSDRGRVTATGGSRRPLAIGSRIWSDKEYVFSVLPEQLEGKLFVRARKEFSDQRIERKGYIYVIAHSDIEDELIKQGFEKTNVPAFIPFVADGTQDYFDPANAISVFQKYVTEGDSIAYGQWGITVF